MASPGEIHEKWRGGSMETYDFWGGCWSNVGLLMMFFNHGHGNLPSNMGLNVDI
jgi:hypothetical protein